MIGAMNNFDVGSGGQYFNAGVQAGQVGSPVAGIGDMIRQVMSKVQGTQDTYLTHGLDLSSKLAQQTNEYGLKKQLYSATDPDTSGPTVQFDKTTGKYFYKNSTPDANGGMKVSWTPVSPMGDTDEEKRLKNQTLKPINDAMEAEAATAAGQNPIQQGASMTNPAKVAVPTAQGNAGERVKVEINGKVGTIPASQLPQALKQGYKRI